MTLLDLSPADFNTILGLKGSRRNATKNDSKIGNTPRDICDLFDTYFGALAKPSDADDFDHDCEFNVSEEIVSILHKQSIYQEAMDPCRHFESIKVSPGPDM